MAPVGAVAFGRHAASSSIRHGCIGPTGGELAPAPNGSGFVFLCLEVSSSCRQNCLLYMHPSIHHPHASANATEALLHCGKMNNGRNPGSGCVAPGWSFVLLEPPCFCLSRGVLISDLVGVLGRHELHL